MRSSDLSSKNSSALSSQGAQLCPVRELSSVQSRSSGLSPSGRSALSSQRVQLCPLRELSSGNSALSSHGVQIYPVRMFLFSQTSSALSSSSSIQLGSSALSHQEVEKCRSLSSRIFYPKRSFCIINLQYVFRGFSTT